MAGLTTNISSNVTNDIHYSFLRNWWAWGGRGDVVQVQGLAGALEPLGESRDQDLSPFNVNTQQTRTRFWDGKDHMVRDILTRAERQPPVSGWAAFTSTTSTGTNAPIMVAVSTTNWCTSLVRRLALVRASV